MTKSPCLRVTRTYEYIYKKGISTHTQTHNKSVINLYIDRYLLGVPGRFLFFLMSEVGVVEEVVIEESCCFICSSSDLISPKNNGFDGDEAAIFINQY